VSNKLFIEVDAVNHIETDQGTKEFSLRTYHLNVRLIKFFTRVDINTLSDEELKEYLRLNDYNDTSIRVQCIDGDTYLVIEDKDDFIHRLDLLLVDIG
jgi:hypothetical protein